MVISFTSKSWFVCAQLHDFRKFWRQHPTRHQLYGHLPPITKTIHVRRTRHARHCWISRDELISDVLLWTPTYGRAKEDDQLEHTCSSYVRIRDVALRTCRRRWTIRRSGERGSGINCVIMLDWFVFSRNFLNSYRILRKLTFYLGSFLSYLLKTW